MKRQELAHIPRTACEIAGDLEVLVIGSQSILGTFDEDDLPAAATASIEADIAVLDDPRRAKADDVEGAIGEMSSFHSTYGIYAEVVHVDTAKFLPDGWRERVIGWQLRHHLGPAMHAALRRARPRARAHLWFPRSLLTS